jgi:hypothetical protein
VPLAISPPPLHTDAQPDYDSAIGAEAKEFVMPEPPANLDRPEPVRPAAPRRAIADWEYRTAYLNNFQMRLPAELSERLRRWAERDRRPAMDLLIDLLEEAVRSRTDAQSPDTKGP